MGEESRRVLVVDDDADVALFVKTVLERRAGCVVQLAPDGAAAVSAIAEFRPDVVVTDIEMPGLSGLELLDAIRAETPWLPVVVMTAHVSVDYAVSALRAQADEFLTKPLDTTRLVEVVSRLADEGRARRESALPQEFVLAVGAHPDDVEIGVGGILAAHRAAGDEVTDAHAVARGTGRRRRRPAARVAARGRPARCAAVPQGPHRHRDHRRRTDRAAHRGGRARGRCRRSSTRTPITTATRTTAPCTRRPSWPPASIDTVACYQSPSSTVDFRPTRFVSIDGFVERKLQLLECFASQTEHRSYLDPDFVTATARYWSRFGGGENVEPLEIVRETADLSTPVRDRAAERTRREQR